jgi:hypothetical protein
VTTFGELYQILRDHFAALRSGFSGTGFPSSPVQGQVCLRTDRGTYGAFYVYSGNVAVGESGWISLESIQPEIVTARGSAASVGARLGVALNADGTLKTTPPAGGWWTAEAGAVAYATASTFTVAGDKTAIYLARRAVTLDGAAAHVVSASYSAGPDATTVEVEGAAVPDPLTAVEYGQPPTSAPAPASATGYVYRGDAFTVTSDTLADVADMSVTVAVPRPSSIVLIDYSCYLYRVGASMNGAFGVKIDSTDKADSLVGMYGGSIGSDYSGNLSLHYLATGLSSGSHTIKIRGLRFGGLSMSGYQRQLRVVVL